MSLLLHWTFLFQKYLYIGKCSYILSFCRVSTNFSHINAIRSLGKIPPRQNLLLPTAISIRASSLCLTVSLPFQIRSVYSHIFIETRGIHQKQKNAVSQIQVHKKDHKLYFTTIHGPSSSQRLMLQKSKLSLKASCLRNLILGHGNTSSACSRGHWLTAANAFYRCPCFALQINSESSHCPLCVFPCYYYCGKMSITFHCTLS